MDNRNKVYSDNIAVCILAGGKGSRLGGIDKGLFLLSGKPLIEHCIERMQQQVSNITINANRNLEKYRDYNFNVLTDLSSDSIGPLGGIQAALEKIDSNFICFVPCDCPSIPLNLIQNLYEPYVNEDYDLSIASVEGKYQPTFFMAKKALKYSLRKFIDCGGRKIMHWVKQTNFTTVGFTNPKQFINLNSKNDIEEFMKNNQRDQADGANTDCE